MESTSELIHFHGGNGRHRKKSQPIFLAGFMLIAVFPVTGENFISQNFLCYRGTFRYYSEIYLSALLGVRILNSGSPVTVL